MNQVQKEELEKFAEDFAESQPNLKPEVPKTWKDLDNLYTKYSNKKEWVSDNICMVHSRALSPNKLTDRFRTENEYFKLIKLPIHTKFHEALWEIVENPGRYYYEGPQGIGKSFTLAEAVLFLRELPSQFRVIYVNNPALWKAARIYYILNEIIWAFMPDRDTFPPCNQDEKEMPPLQQWYEKLQASSNQEEDFRLFLRTAARYCDLQVAPITIISLLDQENWISDQRIFFSPPFHSQYQYPFPLSYYQTFPCVSVNLCLASTNHRTYFKRTQEWIDFTCIFDGNVEDFAFPAEIAQKIVVDSFSAWNMLTSEQISRLAQQIINITGRNANEFMEILEKCTPNPSSYKELQKKISEQFEKRFDDHKNIHEKFLHHHALVNSETYFLAVSYIDTGHRLPFQLTDSFDKRLLYLNKGNLTPLFPLARTVIYSVLAANDFSNTVENLVSQYLDLNIGGEGYLLEFYIVDSIKRMIDKGQFLQLRYKNLRSKEEGTKDFNIKTYVDLVEVPLQKPQETTLYIPLSKSYPDIDCLIYVPLEDTLYPIQITKTQKNHKDSYTNWQRNAEPKWLEVFQGSNVRFIWLVGLPKKYTTKNQNYWVVTFASLPEFNKGVFRQFSEKKERLLKLMERIDIKLMDTDEETFEGPIEDNSDEF